MFVHSNSHFSGLEVIELLHGLLFYMCLRQGLILRDVALDCLPTDTNSAGYLPLTQTINAM